MSRRYAHFRKVPALCDLLLKLLPKLALAEESLSQIVLSINPSFDCLALRLFHVAVGIFNTDLGSIGRRVLTELLASWCQRERVVYL